MRFDTLIFDLDGTLINTLEDLKNSVNYALGEMGYPPRTLDEINRFVGNGVARLVKLSVPAGASEADTEKCLGFFKAHYKAHSAVKTAPYEGIIPMLSEAKEKGLKTAVVTNKMEEAAVDIVKGFFGDNIDVIIGQRDGLAQKPAPDGVLKAIGLLGSDKSRCIYIGDSEVDCLTARNSGLPIIGCTWGFRGREVLEREKADFIIDTPRGIFDCIE